MGYSYFLYGPTVRPDRGAVVMKVGFTAHPNRCGASGNALTFAHELGHILGANHNRATYTLRVWDIICLSQSGTLSSA